MHPTQTPIRALLTRQILSGSALLASTLSASAGPAAIQEAKVEKKEAPPLVSFFDGRVVFDLEERIRFEVRDNNRDFYDAINDDNDDSWFINRFRFGLAVRPLPWLKLYGQLQDTREWNSDRPNTPGIRGTEGEDNFDLRQAYVDISNFKAFPLGLTVGRQRLSYGDQRLVADARWANFGRTFDAVKLRYQAKDFWVDAFASRPVQIKGEVFNDSDSADNFFGLYGSTEALKFQITDIYVLYRDKSDNQPDLDPTNRIDPRGSYNGPAQRITTVGTRWDSKRGELHGWDYNAEFAFQWGDLWRTDRSTPSLDHRAFAAHAAGGYTLEQTTWTPRIGLEYNYATGDRDPNDGKSESFQNLFSSNHDKYGLMDEFAWRNVHDARFVFLVKPVKPVELQLSYHAFWLADTSDYWFRSNGNSVVRTTTPDGRDVRAIGASSFVGHEVDFTVKWNATKWLTVDAGYSHFFSGDYVRDTGPADDADFGYVQAQLLF
jgi:hypothetical protein